MTNYERWKALRWHKNQLARQLTVNEMNRIILDKMLTSDELAALTEEKRDEQTKNIREQIDKLEKEHLALENSYTVIKGGL